MSQGFANDYIVKATGETKVFVNGVKQDSTSGTEIDFTIPSGVKKVTLSFNGVGLDATSSFGVRIGDSGGIATAGYTSAHRYMVTAAQDVSNSTTGFWYTTSASTSNVYTGDLELTLHDAATNLWVIKGTAGGSNASERSVSGSLALSSELTVIRLTGNGSAIFNKGSINIQYENPDLAVTPVINLVDNGVVATGMVAPFAITNPAGDWILCDGSAISRTTYSALYAVLGDAYGNGDGSTTFNLPDYEGRFLRGTDNGKGLDPDAASRTDRGDATTGDAIGTKQDDEFKSHNHIIQQRSAYAGGAGNAVSSASATPVGTTSSGGNETRPVNINVDWFIFFGENLPVAVSGDVVQTINYQDGELATTTTTMPRDDSIPTSTEGGEFMVASVTPKGAANKLRIDVIVFGSHSAIGDVGVAVFQDSGTSAIAVVGQSNVADRLHCIPLTFWMTAGTEVSTTFKVRVGEQSAGTYRFNGTSSGRSYGGKAVSSITITEYRA